MNPQAYIRSLRNPAKRDYAARYLAWLERQDGPEPERGQISYMAAQAVRLTLDSYQNAA